MATHDGLIAGAGPAGACLDHLRAYPIPLGIRNEDVHAGRALLVGDAANLADPWLGEGLYYALASGHLAAEEILAHLQGKTPDLSGYSHTIRARFARQFTYARKLSLLINALPSASVRLLQASSSLQAMIISLLRGEKTHEQVWHGLKTWLPDRLAAKFRKNPG